VRALAHNREGAARNRLARPSNPRKPTLNTPEAQLRGTRPYAHPPHGLPVSILVYRPNTTDHPQKG